MKPTLSVILICCAVAPAGCAKQTSDTVSVSSPGLDATEYGKRLAATKARYPFSRWATSGLQQYTQKACDAFASVFDRLLVDLAALGEKAAEREKLECFHRAVVALNDLNRRDPNLIETEEREQLCELCDVIAIAAGFDPKKYGNGEGLASQWRDW